MAIVAPFLPYERLREIADGFLREHHPSGDLPVPIERIVEFRFGLDIVPIPGLCDKFDIDAYITSDLTEIRVDRFIQERRPNRYRFSLAHELAHFIIHKPIFDQLKFSTVAEWKAAIQSIPQEQYSWIEYQGYALAGLILVPGKPLKDLFDEKSKEAIRSGVDLQELGSEERKVVRGHIGKYFEVSGDVIGKRLVKDKLWT